MSVISFSHVWKEYGDQIVLEDISLDIEDRAFVALVGPSGCGKTTFLRMLLGQDVATRGAILLDGLPLHGEPDADRGVVFQRYSVFPHLTVLGNVMLARELELSPFLGRLMGAAKKDAEADSLKLLDAVGLSGAQALYPASLSGGMQQRLALAQAIMRKPKVLLLDEPFGALDPGIKADIHTLMRKLWHESNLTVVMVTHDLSEAFRLATRVVALERRRDRPEERERYGATIAKDIQIWPRRIAGTPQPRSSSRDDLAKSGAIPGRPGLAMSEQIT